MVAILWSVDCDSKIDKHIEHLRHFGYVWWGVGFRIKWEKFGTGTVGYLHVTKSGGNMDFGTRARCRILDVHRFDYPARPPDPEKIPPHYEGLSYRTWLKLVELERLDETLDTLSMKKLDGSRLRQPPQNYVAIRDPFGDAGYSRPEASHS